MPRSVYILADELLDNFIVLGRILDIRQFDAIFGAAGFRLAISLKGSEGRWTINGKFWMTELQFTAIGAQTTENLTLALVGLDMGFEI